MPITPEGLQRQLDALASCSFCDQRQLAVNFSKTKVGISSAEALEFDCKIFVFSGTTVERHSEYRFQSLSVSP